MNYVTNIQQSGLTIYDPIDATDENLWIPSEYLESILHGGLVGFSTDGLANRTRSKVIKEQICSCLGYPIPKSFKKTQPRFFGQDFDVYVQKSSNLQIWNEEIALERRYVLIRVNASDQIQCVKVVNGNTLATWDKTGTLTAKYQARLDVRQELTELVTPDDTEHLCQILNSVQTEPNVLKERTFINSTMPPSANDLLPIQTLFELLKPLVGYRLQNAGHDQERNRGRSLHQLICQQLGYTHCPDDGSFPDITHQLLEIKLQTSSTIDLGGVLPNSQENLDFAPMKETNLRYCDVRYAIFYGVLDKSEIVLTHFFLTNGEKFFHRFPQFEGKVINR